MSNVTFPISVTVKTGKKENKILVDKTHPDHTNRKTKNSYTIHLKSQPIKGKANQELIRFLSKHFNKKLKIVSGFKNKSKIIDLMH